MEATFEVAIDNNGRVVVMMGRGSETMFSQRMTPEDAAEFGRQLVKVANASPPEDKRHKIRPEREPDDPRKNEIPFEPSDEEEPEAEEDETPKTDVCIACGKKVISWRTMKDGELYHRKCANQLEKDLQELNEETPGGGGRRAGGRRRTSLPPMQEENRGP